MTELEALDEILSLSSAVSGGFRQPNTAPPSAHDFLQALETGDIERKPFIYGSWISQSVKLALRRFLRRPQVDGRKALALLVLCGDLHRARSPGLAVMPDALEHLQCWWESHDRRVDLQGLSELWQEMGGSAYDWYRSYNDFHWPELCREFAQPYFETHLGLILAALESGGGVALRALRLLTYLQPLPVEARPALWALALGEARAEREQAQTCLASDEDKVSRIVQALGDGVAGVREQSALWAARLRLQEAVAPLTLLLPREKVERVRIAQMSALEVLGAPLESFLQPAALLAEGRKILARGLPQELADLKLPVLHWQREGRPVECDLLMAWVVQGLRLKNPQPSAFLMRACSFLNEGERGEMALQLLRWWIDQDTVPRYSAAEIERRLPQGVVQLRQLHQSLIGMAWSNHRMPSEGALKAEVRRNLENEVVGTAIGLKGVLALVGACGGAAVVEMVERYLERWYGMRAAQCKALLAMVGHVRCPEAVQLLLKVAGRFRTKGIQEEASLRLRERAERLGWSVEEMADLGLPTAGLDENSQLCLDFGGRRLLARVDEKFHWSLQDEEGKAYKTLPGAAAGDDVELVKRATRQFKAAQKTVKEVHKSLRDRLYDAMCSGRWWGLETWRTCLSGHPLARFFCQSLVWLASNGSSSLTFRPGDDGSWVSADNATVHLEGQWSVRLAHRLDLSAESLLAWQRHLADYQIVAPLNQLSREAVSRPAESGSEFLGWMVSSFDLRNRAKALGYERGAAEDGGVFMEYRKALATSGWLIRIAISGSALPESQHPVALQGLGFERQGRRCAVVDVPPVLYSEAYNDLREIAAQGQGFAADWPSRVTVR